MSIIQEALKKAEKEAVKVSIDDSPTSFPHSKRPNFFTGLKDYLPLLYAMIFASFAAMAVWLFIAPRGAKTISAAQILADTKVSSMNITGKSSAEKNAVQKTQVKEDIVKVIARSFYRNSNDIALKGIMYSQSEPLAVLNDSIIKEGEQVENVRVVKIRPTSVDVEKAGELITLTLNP